MVEWGKALSSASNCSRSCAETPAPCADTLIRGSASISSATLQPLRSAAKGPCRSDVPAYPTLGPLEHSNLTGISRYL